MSAGLLHPSRKTSGLMARVNRNWVHRRVGYCRSSKGDTPSLPGSCNRATLAGGTKITLTVLPKLCAASPHK